jgi:hypothetical protein
LGLNATPTLQVAQVTAASFKKGAPVYLTGGYLNPTTTDSISSSHIAVTAAAAVILGFVQEDGAADASNLSKVGVIPAVPGMIFKGQLISTTDSSSAGGLHAIEQAHLGTNVGLAVLDGDTHYGVDVDLASSRDPVTIVELIDPVGTVGGQVGFVVRAGWRQMSL